MGTIKIRFFSMLLLTPLCFGQDSSELRFNGTVFFEINGTLILPITADTHFIHEPESNITSVYSSTEREIALELYYQKQLQLFWHGELIQTLATDDLNNQWLFIDYPCNQRGHLRIIKKTPLWHIVFPGEECMSEAGNNQILLTTVSLRTKTQPSIPHDSTKQATDPDLFPDQFFQQKSLPIMIDLMESGQFSTTGISLPHLNLKLAYMNEIVLHSHHDVVVSVANFPITGDGPLRQNGARSLNGIIERAQTWKELLRVLNSILPADQKITERDFKNSYVEDLEQKVNVQSILSLLKKVFGKDKVQDRLIGIATTLSAEVTQPEASASVVPPLAMSPQETELIEALIETTSNLDGLVHAIFIIQGQYESSASVLQSITNSSGEIDYAKLWHVIKQIPNYLISLKRYFHKKFHTNHRLYRALKVLDAYNSEEIRSFESEWGEED